MSSQHTDAVDEIIGKIEDELREAGHPNPNLEPARADLEDALKDGNSVPKGVASESQNEYIMFVESTGSVARERDDPGAYRVETRGVFFFTALNFQDAMVIAQAQVPYGIISEEDPDKLRWQIREDEKMSRLVREDGSRSWDIVVGETDRTDVSRILLDVIGAETIVIGSDGTVQNNRRRNRQEENTDENEERTDESRTD